MNITDRAFIYRVGMLVLLVLMCVVSFLLLLLLLSSILIGGLFLTTFSIVMLLVFAPLKLKNHQINVSRGILFVAAIAMLILFSDLPILEVQNRLDNLNKKVISRGPSALTFKDKLTVYNTNLIISVYGRFLGFPEYARQSFGMFSKTRTPRVWSSDFAVKSPKVVTVINNWVTLLNRHRRDVSHVMLPARRISWQNTSGDRRVALALNPVRMEAKARPVGNRWILECKATTRMKYTRGVQRVIMESGKIALAIPEGPFWALQESDWLKPYTATWTWSIFSDDKRL